MGRKGTTRTDRSETRDAAARRWAGRGGREGRGGHPHSLDKGVSDAWRRCADGVAAAKGVDGVSRGPGLGVGRGFQAGCARLPPPIT